MDRATCQLTKPGIVGTTGSGVTSLAASATRTRSTRSLDKRSFARPGLRRVSRSSLHQRFRNWLMMQRQLVRLVGRFQQWIQMNNGL